MGRVGRAEVDEYLRRFGEEMGVAIAPLSDEGFTAVTRGSATVRINVLEDHGVLLLLCPLMPVPERNREALYRKLLELSFLATSDAAFAIDKKTDVVYLRLLRSLEGLEYAEFADVVHTITTVADEWDAKLKEQFGD